MDNKEIVEHCVKTNTLEFNKDKALEEASEFMEAVLKFNTKQEDNPKRPTLQDIKGEYGDFIYRGFIYLMSLEPGTTIDNLIDEIGQHVEHKFEKLRKYQEEGKYINGL